MYTTPHEHLRKYASAVLDVSSVSVQLSPDIPAPSCNVINNHAAIKHYPFPLTGTDVDEAKWWSSAIHEIWHAHKDNKKDFDILREHKPEQIMMMVHNIVVDHNIEVKGYAEGYLGKNKLHRIGREALLKEIDLSRPVDEPTTKIRALMKFDALCREEWMGIVSPWSVTSDEQPHIDKLMPFKEEYTQARAGGEPNWELSKKIWHALDFSDQEPTPEEQEANASNGQGEGEGSEGQESQAADGQGEGEAQGVRSQDMEVLFKDLKKASGENPHWVKAGLTIKYDQEDITHASGEAYVPYLPEIVYTKDGRKDSYLYRQIRDAITPIGKQLRQWLQASTQSKTAPFKRQGRIDRRQMWRVNKRCGGEHVFTQKQEQQLHDTAIVIACDNSGSMGGTKYINASAASCMIEDAVSGVGVKTFIFGFTDGGYNKTENYSDCPKFYVHKDWGERLTQSQLANNMTAIDMGSNPDGEAVLYSLEKLQEVDSKRKILIVISDGQPAAYGKGGGDCASFLKVCVEKVMKCGIEVYGVGIKSRSVEYFYPNHIYVESTSELEGKLVSLVKDVLKKGLV